MKIPPTVRRSEEFCPSGARREQQNPPSKLHGVSLHVSLTKHDLKNLVKSANYRAGSIDCVATKYLNKARLVRALLFLAVFPSQVHRRYLRRITQ